MGDDKFILKLCLILIFTLILFNVNILVSAEDFGYNLLEPGKDLSPGTNFSIQNVNSSEFWRTDEGILDNVADIEHNWLSNLAWSVAGHIIDIDFDIGVNKFLGEYNWTTTDDWSSFTGSVFDFNESMLSTIFYNASEVWVNTGTPQGSLGQIQAYDESPYNVSEDASDLEFIVNFTGITDFNQLIIRYKSDEADEPHNIQVQIWDVSDSNWEDYGIIPSVGTYHVVEFGVFDADEHIDTHDVVQVRFFQDEGAPPRTHLHNFDWVTIAKGFGTPAGEEVDPDFNSWLGNPIFTNNVNGSTVNSTWYAIFIDEISAKNDNITFNDRILLPDGSITAPALSFGNRSTSGFYLDYDGGGVITGLALSYLGTRVFRQTASESRFETQIIGASGMLGIGNIIATGRLDSQKGESIIGQFTNSDDSMISVRTNSSHSSELKLMVGSNSNGTTLRYNDSEKEFSIVGHDRNTGGEKFFSINTTSGSGDVMLYGGLELDPTNPFGMMKAPGYSAWNPIGETYSSEFLILEGENKRMYINPIGASGTWDIGYEDNNWKDGWFSGTLHTNHISMTGTIDFGTNTITDGVLTGDWDFGSGDIIATEGTFVSDLEIGTYTKTTPTILTIKTESAVPEDNYFARLLLSEEDTDFGGSWTYNSSNNNIFLSRHNAGVIGEVSIEVARAGGMSIHETTNFTANETFFQYIIAKDVFSYSPDIDLTPRQSSDAIKNINSYVDLTGQTKVNHTSYPDEVRVNIPIRDEVLIGIHESGEKIYESQIVNYTDGLSESSMRALQVKSQQDLISRIEVLELFQQDICTEQNEIYNKYDWCDEL